ncbi:MAG: hypothetical protein JWO78_628, partial [Micavibrio sp.]|nr:hypothetical protein [Micavibrio sp.]
MATLPNNAENWSLNVETHSREELIELSRAIAHSLPHRFLQNPENIPYILVPGSGGGGKSMIVEAMMKTLLDECDPDDMKLTNAKNEMFIERHPCQALYKYCQAVGHTNGASVLYGFDRKTSPFSPDAKNQLLHAFKKAARKHGVPPAGAIFTSNGDVGETEPWIVINLNAQGRRWERTLNIEVLNESLKSSLQFQHYWRKLKSFSETGILPGEALAPYPLLPRELFSESIVDPAAPDTELLKFALWHRNALRLSKEMIAQIAANMSDFGSAKAIGDFTAWLKEKNEHDTIELIEAEKSALKRLFFKYVAS